MKKVKISFAVMAAIVAVGCTNNLTDEPIKEEQNDNVFTATIEQQTKTTLDSSNNVLWQTNDEVSIFQGTNGHFCYKVDEGGSTRALLSAVSAGIGNVVLTTPCNIAYYPYDIATACSAAGTLSVTLPAVQSYAAVSFGADANPMVAITNNVSERSFDFKNVGGVLSLKLTGNKTIQKIILSGNNNEVLSGAATVTPVYGNTPTIAMTGTDDANKSVTLDCSNVAGGGVTLNPTTPTEFLIVVPPTTFTRGIKVAIFDTEGTYMPKSSASSLAVARSHEKPMSTFEYAAISANINLNAAFKAALTSQTADTGLIYTADGNATSNRIDANNDGEINVTEAAAVTGINVTVKSLTSLEGVEFFPNLKYLNCFYNNLTSLDVSKNTALTYLDCSLNKLTTLDMSQNTALVQLYCSNNQLTSLNVTNNTALTTLWCSANQLASLNVTNNTALEVLWCSDNQLTSLDLTNNTLLRGLNCDKNLFTSLNLAKNTALTYLQCYNNKITGLDVSQNTKLTRLDCSDNQLTTFNVEDNTALTEFKCRENQLTWLDVTPCTELTSLDCSENQLSWLDVTNCRALKSLYCYSNKLTTLNVSSLAALSYLDCSPMDGADGNILTKLILATEQVIQHINAPAPYGRSDSNVPAGTNIYVGGVLVP